MKKIILLIAIVSIALFGYFSFLPEKAQIQRARAIPNVVVAKVEVMPIRDEVEALGTGKAYESIIVTSKVAEIVNQINFDDGELVEKGAVLVMLRNDEQKAKVAVAEVKLAENLRELDRIRALVTSKTIAELERDRLQSLIDTTRAEVEQANAALHDRIIKAPFSGRLGLRQVSVGSLVTPGEQISTLDDVSKIKLDFSVPERFIQELKPGKLVEASAVAYPDRVFKGVVTSIDSRVNPDTRAVIVRAVMPNSDFSLLPGMLMKVKLIKQSREALLLPEAAIIPIQNNHFVYVVNADNKVEQVKVTLGIRTRGWVEITNGLEVGKQVIIRGILKVRPGDEVKVQQAENFKFAQVEGTEKSA
ncbi:efflux RND transporter periplasmic adaptor subunit [Shewanella litoralis]|uniref:MexH family multidrug efflux RND transporter periplasmic adaptor subunit n=1 Tax=Shewanella litoralis TaxID=2282700 RepID=A0ABQ2R288_9GAMM|nr:efflux RND transporter periplasmic adaptor subunit [Shewanella litoralis]GGQ06506.1 MexH family multidrug efflux RND transporter periplasmic adaptor subunit [Shewanella litoralis]